MSTKMLSDIQAGDAVVLFNGSDEPFAWREVEEVSKQWICAAGVRFSVRTGKILKTQPKNGYVFSWAHPSEALKGRLADQVSSRLMDVVCRIEFFDKSNLQVVEGVTYSLTDIQGADETVTLAEIARMLNEKGMPESAELFVKDGQLCAVADRLESLQDYENRVYREPERRRAAKKIALDRVREEEEQLVRKLEKKAEEKARLLEELAQ